MRVSLSLFLCPQGPLYRRRYLPLSRSLSLSLSRFRPFTTVPLRERASRSSAVRVTASDRDRTSERDQPSQQRRARKKPRTMCVLSSLFFLLLLLLLLVLVLLLLLRLPPPPPPRARSFPGRANAEGKALFSTFFLL